MLTREHPRLLKIVIMIRTKIHFFLILLLIGSFPLILNSQIALSDFSTKNIQIPKGFEINNGYFHDQNGKLNEAVRYIFENENFKVHLRHDGFSYETYNYEGEKTNIHRIDFKFNNCNPSSFLEYDRIEFPNLNIINEFGSFHKAYCKKVVQKNIWEGVDIEYLINEESGMFKYNYIVHSKNALNKIKIKAEGAVDINLEGSGLIFSTTNGQIVESIPESFNANSENIDVLWSQNNFNDLGFILNDEVQYPITIDPLPYRIWGKYIGGTYDDGIRSIDVDSSGNIVFCGFTASTGLATTGAYQNSLSSSAQTEYDGWVGKLNRYGYLKWATYMGGSKDDRFKRITVTPDNHLVVVGNTYSTNFPTKNAFQSSNKGSLDAVVCKFSDTGGLLWSTYYGGTGVDDLNGIVSDKSGNIYTAGYTSSSSGVTNGSSSVWKKSRQSSNQTDDEGWLIKLTSSGSRTWSTLIGSYDGDDMLTDVGYDVDKNRIVVGGITNSTSKSGTDRLHYNFSSSGSTNFNGGKSDGFLASFNLNGGLYWSRYFGDTSLDELVAVVCDTGGAFYAVGNTASGTNIATSNGFQTKYGGVGDGWLGKFNVNGSIEWGTYIGGTLSDYVWDLDMDTFNYLYLIGVTESFYDSSCNCVDSNAIYTPVSHQQDINGGYDAFIQKFNKNGDRLWSTFYGDRANEGGVSTPDDYIGIATGILDDVFVGGFTASRGTGVLDSDTFPGISNGAYDGFLARFNQCDTIARGHWLEPTCQYDSLKFYSYDIDSNYNVPDNWRYEWTGPSGWTSNIQNPIIPNSTRDLNDGNYQLVVYDSVGCTDTVRLEVTLKYVEFFGVQDTVTICLGDTIAFTGIRAYDDGLDYSYTLSTYEWSGPDSFTSNDREPIVSDISNKLNRGWYKLKATTIEGCWDTTSVFVNVGFADSIRSTDTVCLYSSTRMTIDDISKYSNYKWEKPDGSIINDSVVNINVVQYSDTGNYKLYLEKSSGCKDTINSILNLALETTSDFNVSDNSQCLTGNSFQFFYDSTGNVGKVDSLFWMSSDSTTGYQKATAIDSWSRTYVNSGTYNIRLISKSNQGCFDTTLKSIYVRPEPVVDFTINNDTQCLNGNSFSLVNTSTISAGRFDSIAWVYGDGTITQGGKLNSSLLVVISNNATKTYDSAGTYNISLFLYSAFGCNDSVSKSVLVWPKNNTSIQVDIDSQCVDPNKYKFSNYDTLSQGTLNMRFWQFGDGSMTIPGGNVSNPEKTYSDSGNYNISYITRTNNGCYDTALMQVYVRFNNNLRIDSTIIQDVLCQTDSLGNIFSFVSGGNGTISFKWYNDDDQLKGSNQDLLGVGEDGYYLILTDSFNCVSTSNIDTIISLSKIIIDSITSTTIDCHNDSTSSITLSLRGGISPLTYLWFNNNDTIANTKDISNIWADTFVVRVTDDSLCFIEDSIIVTQPDSVIVSSIDVIPVTCKDFNDASIIINANGGNQLQYSIDSGNTYQNSNRFDSLSPGNYNVFVRDVKGCIVTYKVSQKVTTIESNLLLTYDSLRIDNIDCFGNNTGKVSLKVQGGTQPYSYSWKSLTDSTFNSSNKNQDSLFADYYSFSVTDSFNCKVIIDTVLVTEPSELQAVISTLKNVDCYGTNTALGVASISGGTSSFSVKWVDESGITQSTKDSLVNAYKGIYNFYVVDSQNCTDTILNISITEPDSLYIDNVVIDSVNCFSGSDGSINVDVIGGTQNYSFQWTEKNQGSVSTTEDLLNQPTGIYTLTLEDKNGCTDTLKDVTINQPDSISISNIAIKDVDCYSNNTGEISLQVSGGVLNYNYEWRNSKGVVVSTSQNLLNVPAENYILTVRDFYSCTAKTASLSVKQPDRLIVSIDSQLNIDCKSNNTGKIITKIAGGNGGNYFVWYNSTFDTVTVNQDLRNVKSGSYIFYVTDSVGCQDSLKNIVLTEPDTLIITNLVITNVDCYGNSTGLANVDVTGGTTAYTYIWTDSTGKTIQTNQDLINVPIGKYQLVVNDKNLCTDTFRNIRITQPDSLDIVLTAKENVDCFGNSTGDLFMKISGGITPYNYQWIKNSSLVSTQKDLRSVPIGIYNLILTDSNGCQKAYFDTITQPDLFKFDSFDVKGVQCYGDSNGAIYPIISGGVAPFEHVWYDQFNDTLSLTKNLIDIPRGTYYSQMKDDSGCIVTSSNIFVDQPSTPLSIYNLKTTNLICWGDSNGTADYLVFGGTTPYSYSWKLNSTTVSTNKKLENAKAGKYTLIVEDDSACLNEIANVTITEPDRVQLDTALINNPSCEFNNDGSIQAIGKGGNYSYRYSIDSGNSFQSSRFFTNLDTGLYYLQIIDSNNCESPVVEKILSNGDMISPTVRTNDLIIYLDSNGMAKIELDSVNDNSFDNCEIDTMFINVDAVSCSDIPDIFGWLYVVDLNGNIDSSQYKLTIFDSIKPNVEVVDTIYTYLDSFGNSEIEISDILISTFDNCGINDTLISKRSFDCGNLGVNSITTTISDIHKNISTKQTIVIVLDTISPRLIIKDITLYLDTNGEVNFNFGDFDNGSFDECLIDSFGIDKQKLYCSDTGINVVNLWVIDGSGNESRNYAYVTVYDTISPKFEIQSKTVILDYNGEGNLTKTDLLFNVWDNCGVYDTSYSQYDFNLTDSGLVTVYVTVYDIHGNVTKKPVIVNVLWGDADRDSIPDHIEGNSDFDGDGIPNYLDLDSDNDGVLDVEENEGKKELLDLDGDGNPNVWDLDTDGDGIDDVIEADGDDPDLDGIVGTGKPDVDQNGVPVNSNGGYNPVDTDGDGDKDYKDLDTDNDGILDETERGNTKDPIDTDNDGVKDWRDLDSDGDGISDEKEKIGLGTDDPADSDNDGIPDYRDLDSDNDGITDNYEKGSDGDNPDDTDNDGIPDYLDSDSDNDGIPDLVEGDKGGDNPTDTDGDGIPDFRDLDADGDGIPDSYEKGKNGNNPDDTDGDLIPDYRDLDSDDDGIKDSLEAGDDPKNPVDTDGDGIDDYLDEDSDNDGWSDADEAGDNPDDPEDSDGDGIYNFRELDSDDDELLDEEELTIEKTRIPDIWIPEGISINEDTKNEILYIKGLKNFPNSSVLIFNRWGQLVYESGLGYSNQNPFDGKYNGSASLYRKNEYLPEGVYFLIYKSNDSRGLVIRQSLYIKK